MIGEDFGMHARRFAPLVRPLSHVVPRSAAESTQEEETAMDETRFDESVELPTGPAGRRDALRSLGTAGLGLLAALGLHGAAAKNGKGGGRKGRGKKDRKKDRPRRAGNPNQARPDAAPPDENGAVDAEGLGLSIQIGPTGPTGPTGATGAQSGPGPTGPQGGPGPTGPGGSSTSRVNIGPVGNSTTGFASSQADCDPGWHAVGGGMSTGAIESGVGAVSSFPEPLDEHDVARGWRVGIHAMSPGSLIHAQAYVICVPD